MIFKAEPEAERRFSAVWIAAAALFFAGQGWLLISGQYVVGGMLSLAGVLLAMRKIRPQAPWLSVNAGLAAAGLASACLGAWQVRTSAWLGLAWFALSGILVFIANARWGQNAGLSAFSRKSLPRQGWEPWFLLLLLLLGVCSRACCLNEYPAGVCFHESVMADVCAGLKHQPYTPHSDQDHANFPSLIFYQGLLSAKILGWNPAAFRMPAAWWGIFSLLAFYFLARRLTSAGTAAVASLLYAASGLHVAISRWFFPGSLLFFSPVAAWMLLLIGLRQGRGSFFVLAGAAAALSLHGYFPGRVMPLILACWLVWLWLADRPQALSWKQCAWLASGFLLAAAPIMAYAIGNPKSYWHDFLHSANPDLAGNILTYLKNTLPQYARMFHVRSDFDYSLHVANQPLLDPVTGVLFPLGLFASLGAFWKPKPAWTLILFLGGLAPAVFGGIFQHPTVRRTLVALPAVYLFATLGLERLRLALNPGNRRGLNLLLAGAGVLAAVWVMGFTYKNYFQDFAAHPGARVAYNYRIYAMAEQIRKYPGARVRLTPESGATAGWSVLLPPEASGDRPSTPEELLVLDPKQDQLLLLNPMLEIYRGFFERNFPQARVTVYRETRQHEPVCSQGYYTDANDPYNPLTYLVSIWIPKADIRRFQRLLNVTEPGAAQSEDVWHRGFGALHAGQALKLAGAVFLEKSAAVAAHLDWPGWTIRWDDEAARAAEPQIMSPGIHYFEAEGRVPGRAQGPLPLHLLAGSQDLVAAHRVAALLPGMGLRTQFFPAKAEHPKLLDRQELFPEKRYYLMNGLPGEFNLRSRGLLTVPASGEYTFTARELLYTRLRVNGRLCFDNYAGREKPEVHPMVLEAGRPAVLEGETLIEVDMHGRVFMVLYQGPGQNTPAPVPPEWIRPF